MTTAAIITTRNEEDTIGPLVTALKSHYDVLVIDDASEDDTYNVALNAGAMARPHLLRTGIGPSLMEGWRWALGRGADSIVQLDAGGSHDPAEAGRLVSALQDFDMVIGSRFLPGSGYIGNVKRAALTPLCNWTQAARTIRLKRVLYWKD